MKALFQNLDLYKAIILLSLVLTPVVGYWAYSLDEQIKHGRVAIDNSLKASGELEEIGKFQKAIEEQRANRDKQGGDEAPGLYFQKHILSGAARLSTTNLSISPARDQTVSKKNAIDRTVQIDFKDESNKKRGKLILTREEILAVLFMCESPSPIWNLRELSMRNVWASSTSTRGKAPPIELEDNWQVNKLVFASRRPKRPQ